MSLQLFDLSGKVVLVTGACGHLGRAMVEGLAEAGATLALCSTSLGKAQGFAAEIADRFKVTAHGFCLDLRQVEELKAGVDKIASHFGRLDCLVNNGCFVNFNDLESMTPQEWNEGMQGGAGSPFFLMQACISHLEKTRGNVINIASMYGVVAPKPQNYTDTPFSSAVNYGASKAALLQLTRYASAYLGPKGMRVNAISPGPFPTPEVQKNDLFAGRLAVDTMLGRLGHPDELKGAVVFLASNAASYITGHNLVVDGGWTSW